MFTPLSKGSERRQYREWDGKLELIIDIHNIDSSFDQIKRLCSSYLPALRESHHPGQESFDKIKI